MIEISERLPPHIGLALSGGGYRAAAFHLGVLRRLADEGLLECVTVISTVSGGSLATAAIMSASNNKWPSSKTFLLKVYPAVEGLLTKKDLFSLPTIVRGLLCLDVRLFRQRALFVASLLQRKWGVNGMLKDLPETPLWWINATCLETGKNWRFSKRRMGDWVFGTLFEPSIKIAHAAAASAAVPYVIGVLSLKLPKGGWFRTDPASKVPIEPIDPPTQNVRLWDGGAYENLGLEPLMKEGSLIDCDILLCSDASGAVTRYEWSSPFALLRGGLWSPRLFDVASDQIRSLRSRILIQDLKNKKFKGALIRMGNSVRAIDVKMQRSRAPGFYDSYLSGEDVRRALAEPTGLKALSTEAFQRIARHGYEAAEATLAAHIPSLMQKTRIWEAA